MLQLPLFNLTPQMGLGLAQAPFLEITFLVFESSVLLPGPLTVAPCVRSHVDEKGVKTGFYLLPRPPGAGTWSAVRLTLD